MKPTVQPRGCSHLQHDRVIGNSRIDLTVELGRQPLPASSTRTRDGLEVPHGYQGVLLADFERKPVRIFLADSEQEVGMISVGKKTHRFAWLAAWSHGSSNSHGGLRPFRPKSASCNGLCGLMGRILVHVKQNLNKRNPQTPPCGVVFFFSLCGST